MSLKRDVKDTLSFGVIAAIVVAGVLLFAGGVLLVSKLTAGFRGDVAVTNKTKGSGNYRISAYDHFFDLCASVQNQEVTIAAQKDELANPATTPDRAGQIRANLSALTANRGELINQYNVDSAKSYTQGQFRDSRLPYHLDPTQESTTCTA